MRKRVLFLSFFVALMLCPTIAFAITVNGDLSDWGVDPSIGDWTPNSKVRLWTVEDSANAKLQKVDAEAMYAFYSGSKGVLYSAIVTGMPPWGVSYGGKTYAPGDYAIDFGNDGIYEYAIETSKNGPFVSGTVVSTGASDWSSPMALPTSQPASITGGIDTSFDAKVAYNNKKGAYGTHYVIELAIPVDAFGSLWGMPFTLHWTTEFGYDEINLRYSRSAVPEPATLVLLGVGLIGVAAARRRLTPKAK